MQLPNFELDLRCNALGPVRMAIMYESWNRNLNADCSLKRLPICDVKWICNECRKPGYEGTHGHQYQLEVQDIFASGDYLEG